MLSVGISQSHNIHQMFEQIYYKTVILFDIKLCLQVVYLEAKIMNHANIIWMFIQLIFQQLHISVPQHVPDL